MVVQGIMHFSMPAGLMMLVSDIRNSLMVHFEFVEDRQSM